MPNRIIKESICTSENIDQLSAFNETVFYRLIVNVDDYGRIDARPKLLSAKLFPLKDIRATQIEDALRKLTSAELVTLYEVDGKPFLQMNTWDRHQTIRAKKSKCPAPESGTNTSEIICKQLQADESKCSRNPIQSESESESNTKESARIAKRFTPPSIEDVEAYCKERGNKVNAQTFVDFYSAKGWKVGQNPMKDWKAAVRTWEQRDNNPVQQQPRLLRAQQYEQREYKESEMQKLLGVDDLYISDEEYFKRYGKHSPYVSGEENAG